METLNNNNCLANRPGGFVITDRAINFCSFPAKAKLIDLGCGSGASVNYVREKYGFETFGLDKNYTSTQLQKSIFESPAEAIPFGNETMDGVLMECSFSLMDNQKTVLSECYRVLKTGGYLLISDMYARGEAVLLKGCLGRLDTQETLVKFIENNGFKIELFEDYSPHLNAMWGQLIFDKGAKSFYCDLGITPEAMKRIKCGYFLIVAKKESK